MKALITGRNSVLGEPMARLLRAEHFEVVTWDRAQVPPENAGVVAQFMARTQPQFVFHFAVGATAWAAQLAGMSHQLNAVFVFTSSVSVFSGRQVGPFLPTAVPEPEDDYGRYKHATELAVLQANPEARVARIGWQIGAGPGSNNMVDYLETTFAQHGRIAASVNWFQACSFVEDTVVGLYHLATAYPGGVYHLDSNPGLSFHAIVTGLNRQHGARWQVATADEPRLDNRLWDERIKLRPLTEHF